MSTGASGTSSRLPDRFADIDITGLTADSRAVQPGNLFAALPGAHADGRTFIKDAIARGARAVLAPRGTALEASAAGDVALITDDNPRARLAQFAAAYYAPQPDFVAAVTGTNGKSSVVDMARQLWTERGHSAASIGTLGVTANGTELAPPGLTSPDPIALHQYLSTLARRGASHVAIEASSHGLDQARLEAVRIKAAAFTSFGRDHLDYHRDAASYFAAKARLFTELLAADGTAVLNADDDRIAALADSCAARGHSVLRYGANGDVLRLHGTTAHAAGQTLDVEIDGRRADIPVPLVGRFQAHNLLAAAGLLIASRDAAGLAATLGKITGVRGRMEHVGSHPGGAGVFVDYAHTHDALETALTAIRPHATARVVVVFGAGGDRDRGKRPLMGRAAAAHADLVFVTDDNPRSERPELIRREIIAGCPEAIEIADRADAIAAAIDALQPGDVLVIAGKGHETGQIVGDAVLPFDDRAVAQSYLAALSADGGGKS